MSFTGNRQDASLQAGHFNDFVQSPCCARRCTGRVREWARTRALIEAGYIVIRFHHAADWSDLFRRHPDLFGTPSE